MHQRDLCLCPDCIARVGVHEAEIATVGRAWFEACKARHSATESVTPGVVRRKPRAR